MSVQKGFAFWPRWPNFGDIGMVSARPSVRPSGVSDHYLKKWSLNSFQILCRNLLGECSELIRFWATLVQFWPSSGQKITDNGPKWWFPTIIWKSIHTIQFKLDGYTYWVSIQKWFAFWPRWTNFGPPVATKLLKMVVSDHYLKKYSCKPIQTCCVHLLGECSELICFLATLAKFWPSSGHKITENVGFWPISEKVPLFLNLFQTLCLHWLDGSSKISHIGII